MKAAAAAAGQTASCPSAPAAGCATTAGSLTGSDGSCIMVPKAQRSHVKGALIESVAPGTRSSLACPPFPSAGLQRRVPAQGLPSAQAAASALAICSTVARCMHVGMQRTAWAARWLHSAPATRPLTRAPAPCAGARRWGSCGARYRAWPTRLRPRRSGGRRCAHPPRAPVPTSSAGGLVMMRCLHGGHEAVT